MLEISRETTVYITVSDEKDKQEVQNMYSFVDNQCVLDAEDVRDLMQVDLISVDDFKDIEDISDLSDIILTLD
jgi:hypothetical protein